MSKLLEKDNNSTDDQSDSENQKMSIKINDKVQKGGKDVIMTEEKKEISQEVKKDKSNMQCDEGDEKKEGVKDSVKSSMEDVNSTQDALKPTSESTKPVRETEKKEPEASKATIGSTNSTSEPSKSVLEASNSTSEETKSTSEATKPTSEATNPTSDALKPPLETTQPPPTSSEPIKPTQSTPEIKEEIIDYSEFPPDTVTTLTKNGIKILHDNDQVWGKTDPQRNLTLQILECREMGAKSEGKFKMRFKLSDGFSSITVVLCKSDSTPTNDNTEYKKFGIVKIIRPRLLKVNKTNILTIQVNPEIIYGFSYNKIGTPIDYTERILTGNFPETVPTPYIDKDDIKAHIKGGIKCKRSLKDDCYTPIKVLNTYTHDWKIKVRVIKKNKRSWTNMKGSGVVMTLDLIDSASSQIQERTGVLLCILINFLNHLYPLQASFFNDAVLKFDNVIQENCVYTMTNGTVRPANKRFTSIDNNFCINFEIHGKIEKVEDEGVIADQAFDFKTAKQIADMEDIKTIDFIGVVHHVTPIVTINTKNGERKEKRTISMADDSGMSINLSIWGDQTTMIDFEQNPHPVIAIKGVKISLYGGKSLNLIRESTVSIDPQIKETERLKEWYKTFIEKESNQLVGLSFDSPGSSLDQAQATERLLIESDEFLHEQFSKAPDKCCYFCVNGYINNIKSDEKCIYMACPDETCSKKVYYQHDIQRYRCDTCNLDYEEAKPKFMLMVRFSDFTNTCYTFFYKDTAPLIMDCTPDVLKEFKNQGDNQSYSDAFTRQQYKKYKLLMRARIATYAGGTKVTYSAAKVMDYNFKNENHSLLERLALYDKKQTTPEQDMMMYNMEQEANFYGNGGINNFFGNTPTGFSRPNNMF